MQQSLMGACRRSLNSPVPLLHCHLFCRRPFPSRPPASPWPLPNSLLAFSWPLPNFPLGKASAVPLQGSPAPEAPLRRAPWQPPLEEAPAGPPQGSPAPEVARRQFCCEPPFDAALSPQPPDLFPVARQDAPRSSPCVPVPIFWLHRIKFAPLVVLFHQRLSIGRRGVVHPCFLSPCWAAARTGLLSL